MIITHALAQQKTKTIEHFYRDMLQSISLQIFCTCKQVTEEMTLLS